MGYKEFKLEIPSVKNLRLKFVFFTHFLLFSWATLGNWAPTGYFLQAVVFLFLLLWTLIKKDGEDHVLACLAVNVIELLLDIIILSIYFPRKYSGSTAEFSAVMAVFNLVFRVYSSYVLYTEWCVRSGTEAVTVVDSSRPPVYGEGGTVRSASVLTHFPGQGSGSPRMAPVHTVQVHDKEPIPTSFTVIN